MEAITHIPETRVEQIEDRSGIAGHPRGLTPLFLTEVWERFSYYGMRALLVLYMAAPLADGGLEFSTSRATTIYGIYTAAVYLMSLPGGWLADRFLGARLTVLLGGIVIAAGHFSMAFASLPTFYGGLGLIVIGTGLLKPNISTMVGSLYGENDPRRDSGFSIFYMGINIGAMLGPLVAGYLGQRVDWHLGFAAAGFGMVLGIVQYLFHMKRLSKVGSRPERIKSATAQLPKQPLTNEEKRRLAIIAILFFFSILFWTSFEQAGSSFNLFAERHTETQLFGFDFPSTWLQSVNSVWILTLAPLFSWLWVKWGARQPSSPAKFSIGLLFLGIGMAIIAIAALLIDAGKVSPLWLIAVYFIHTVGELCLSPVGLSTVTKLSPARIVGLMMGVWFLSVSLGNYAAGWAAGFYQDDSTALFRLFGALALASLVGSAVLGLANPFIRKMTGRS